MIERCNYCGETHDVGDGSKLFGMVVKVCPNHPENSPGTFIRLDGRDAQVTPLQDYGDLEDAIIE